MAVLKDAFIVSLFLGMSLQAASSPDSDGVASPGGGREVVSSALDRARSLRAPAVLEKLGGEYEGADFWDENHALLKAAWGELGQLHSYVYAPSPEQALVPAAARALQSSNPVEALLSLTKETEVVGVHAIDLLSPSFCSDLLEELAHIRSRGAYMAAVLV
ncbi:hypothetical protein T484DRAFT_1787558 [Baffinella frigidus]|nr:hypothetical protein T484DRAFT_1787558 [Cryptophyta sp. CCMP2293]